MIRLATPSRLLWKWSRRLTQALALFAILVAPFLGGWQRLDRNNLSGWEAHGWDLPAPLLDQLPAGEAAKRAYDLNVMMGGGTAVEYASIPIADPVGGALAMAHTAELAMWPLVAWVLPLLLAAVAGRVFCGWFCPFGVLARMLDGVLDRLPWRIPHLAPPRRRWARYVLLVAALALGAIGSQLLLYLTLPHLLVQQSAYSMWLMGGGGAVLGALIGLLVVGVVMGPTLYCATVCPTGAALALAGRARLVKLRLVEPRTCGALCDLCDRACWLFLEPSSGDPGPDCDLCGRCVDVCPSTNLRLTVSRPRLRLRVLASLVLFVVAACGGAQTSPVKPGLVLDSTRHHDEVEVAASIVDLHGVELDPTNRIPLTGVEVSVYLARGPRGQADALGKLPEREVYRGPLSLELLSVEGQVLGQMDFAEPNTPASTIGRSVYRDRVDMWLIPGDRLELAPIPGWTEGEVWVVPEPNSGGSGWRAAGFVIVGFLLFGGLVSLALAARERDDSGS